MGTPLRGAKDANVILSSLFIIDACNWFYTLYYTEYGIFSWEIHSDFFITIILVFKPSQLKLV